MMYVVTNKIGVSKRYFGLYFAYIYTHARMLGQIMSQYMVYLIALACTSNDVSDLDLYLCFTYGICISI